MAGTKAGGLAAAATNKSKYGKDFYATIGAKGGRLGRTGGFAARFMCDDEQCPYDKIAGDHRVAQCAGYKGGTISRKGKARA